MAMNFNGNNGFPFQNGFNGGAMYTNQPPKKPLMTNPLTEQEVNQLKQKEAGFTLRVDPVELLKAKCTHRDPKTGQFTVVANPDNTVTCTTCGETFDPEALDQATVQKISDLMINALQTTKFMYLDQPDASITQYYQMIPFIKKLPKLYELAMHNFNQYHQASNNVQQANNGFSGFGMLNSMMGPGPAYGGYGFGQPMPNPYMNQPMMGYPQPQQTAFTQQANAMVNGNPFQADPNQAQVQPQAIQPQAAPAQTTNGATQMSL